MPPDTRRPNILSRECADAKEPDGLAQDGVSVAVQRRYATPVASQHRTVLRMPSCAVLRRNGINDIARSEHQPAQARVGLPRHAQTTFGGMAAAWRTNAMKHGAQNHAGTVALMAVFVVPERS